MSQRDKFIIMHLQQEQEQEHQDQMFLRQKWMQSHQMVETLQVSQGKRKRSNLKAPVDVVVAGNMIPPTTVEVNTGVLDDSSLLERAARVILESRLGGGDTPVDIPRFLQDIGIYWRNGNPVAIEILLTDDSEDPRTPVQKEVVLEVWTLELRHLTTLDAIVNQGNVLEEEQKLLMLALRSFLHFSPLNSWLLHSQALKDRISCRLALPSNVASIASSNSHATPPAQRSFKPVAFSQAEFLLNVTYLQNKPQVSWFNFEDFQSALKLMSPGKKRERNSPEKSLTTPSNRVRYNDEYESESPTNNNKSVTSLASFSSDSSSTSTSFLNSTTTSVNGDINAATTTTPTSSNDSTNGEASTNTTCSSLESSSTSSINLISPATSGAISSAWKKDTHKTLRPSRLFCDFSDVVDDGASKPSRSTSPPFVSSSSSPSAYFPKSSGLPIASSPDPRKRQLAFFTQSNPIPIGRRSSSLSSKRPSNLNKSLNETNQHPTDITPHRDTFSTPITSPYSGIRPRVNSLERMGIGAKRLLGSFEESLLSGRMSNWVPNTVTGFMVELGASGCGKTPSHVRLPLAASFYKIPGEFTPSPYVGVINLAKESCGQKLLKNGRYRVPPKGLVQLMLYNPQKTGVKVFLVNYDFTTMPAKSRTFLRQRTYLEVPQQQRGASKLSPPSNSQKGKLLYAVHLKFVCTKPGRIYVDKEIRVVFSHRAPDSNDRVRTVTEGPTNPIYSPIKNDSTSFPSSSSRHYREAPIESDHLSNLRHLQLETVMD